MIKVTFYLFPLFLLAQNVDMYLSLLHDGQKDGVNENLPELISKYPNDPGVLYLQGLLTMDGMKSLEIYSSIIEKFPKSKYSPAAAMKIGEYFYARGLYTQAARQLCQIPRSYPRYPDIQRVLDLTVSSFLAVGEEDSARYYVGIYQGMFPDLNVNGYGFSTTNQPTKPMNFKSKLMEEPKPYIVQIGAFGNFGNAKRLKLQVSQIGYNVEIVPVEINGSKFHAVRVVRYKNKSEAERVGIVIKKKLGIDYRVLYRPKNYMK